VLLTVDMESIHGAGHVVQSIGRCTLVISAILFVNWIEGEHGIVHGKGGGVVCVQHFSVLHPVDVVHLPRHVTPEVERVPLYSGGRRALNLDVRYRICQTNNKVKILFPTPYEDLMKISFIA